MDIFEYTFTSKVGDRYIVKIQNDGFRMLSDSLVHQLENQEIEVWGIYLNRIGSYKNVTSMKDLSVISRQIYNFFESHENVVLYYVCDDLAAVPMNPRKAAEGFTVQYYRNRLFTALFKKLQNILESHVIDMPICIDACGNDMYIHVISRVEHQGIAAKIKQDVLEGFSK